MKAKLLSISALFLILLAVGCEKNGSGPAISLKLKSLNATEFHRNDKVVFKFDFTPASAEEDTLFVKRKFYSCAFSIVINDSLSYFKFPEYTVGGKGELEYSFIYASSGAGGGGTFFDGCFNGATARRTDSVQYTFWVKDKDGKVSDTVQSPKIILYNN
jgi:hypothetical protein